MAMQMSRQIQPRIFLSYAHEDKLAAETLAQELQRHGADIWIDSEKLTVGDSLARQIETAIRESDMFLVLISPASERSKWIERELELALKTQNRTRVVPVLLPGASMGSNLQDVLYLQVDSEDFGAAAEQLLHASHGISSEESDANAVEEILATLKVAWSRQPSIAGVRPDFLVETSDSRRIVIELTGRPNPGLLEVVEARSQASRIRDLTGADAAVVVVPKIEAALPDAGIVGLADLGSFLSQLLSSLPRPSPLASVRPEPAPVDNSRTVFASMPFKPQYEDVFWFAMAAAAEAVNATCIRVDREDFNDDIPTKIKADIESSIAVIADLSESNPDVLYEVGYARKNGSSCVHICSTPLNDLPFNVRNINTLSYGLRQIHALREPLTERLKAALT